MLKLHVRAVSALTALLVLVVVPPAPAQNATPADELLAHAKSVYSSTGPSAALPE